MFRKKLGHRQDLDVLGLQKQSNSGSVKTIVNRKPILLIFLEKDVLNEPSSFSVIT